MCVHHETDSSSLVRFPAFFFFKQKTAYEMRISDWSSDVCSSDLPRAGPCAASTDAGQAPGISSARIPPVRHAHDRCSAAGAQGSEVSPSRLLQDQLVERQVGDRPPEPKILLLQILHAPRLVGLQTAIRSEESRVGKECVSTCRTRWSQDH